jgi:hypothetical protein
MEVCEAREYGTESKRKHQVEGAIMQATKWTERLEGATPWSTWSRRNKAIMSALEKNQEEERGKSPIQLFVRVL